MNLRKLSTLKVAVFLLLGFSLFFNAAVKGQMRQVYLDTVVGNEVHNFSLYSPSEGYVAFRDWIGYTSDSCRTFTKKYITNSNVNYNGYSVNLTFGFEIIGVKAFNQNTFIAYGDYGLVPAILYTTNGGTTYTLIFHSQFAVVPNSTVRDMVFPQNGTTGYAVDFDRILKTTNGGLSWSVIRVDPNSFFNHIESIDDNNLIVMSTEYASNKLLKTNDGGTTWQNVSLPNLPGGKFYYACFLTPSIGWVNMYDNNQNLFLYKTTNGGTTWTLLNDIVATPFACSKMKFVDINTGYALQGFTVLKTLDGGVIWEPLPRDNNYSYLGFGHNDLQLITNNQLWVGGGHGFIELSTNGGGTPLPKAYFKIDTTGVNLTNTVNLLDFSRPGYNYQWYVNNVLVSTNYSTSYTHNWLSLHDSIKLVVKSGILTDTLLRIQNFYLPNFAVLSSFFPVAGSTGTLIMLTGSGFSGVTNVKFGVVSASTFTILNSTTIAAIVANGATGSVTITDYHGSSSQPNFTYFPPPGSQPPALISLSPESGPIGTTLTINGNNFGATPADNNIFFGAVKGNIISASPSQIVCTVPAGANFEPISILNQSTHLSGQSFKPFNVTFADSTNFTTHSFTEAYTIDLGISTYTKWAIGKDLDNDGKPDIITITEHFGTDSVSIYRNTTTGSNFSFEPKLNLGAAPYLGSNRLVVGDIDNDGKPDIVSPSIITANPVVFRNTSVPGLVSFDTQFDIPLGGGTMDIAIADLDNDGKNDIITAGYSNSLVNVTRNTSTPGFLSFGKTDTLTSFGHATNVAVGDLDGDGKKDIVALSSTTGPPSSSAFSYFKNVSTTGNILFAPKVDIILGAQGIEIYLVDYDNDGKLDVVIIGGNNYNLIYRNISSPGTIAFAPVDTISTNNTGHSGNMSNLNGDMKPDLMWGSFYNPYLSVIDNVSTPGSILNNNPIGLINDYVTSVNTADFDLDGKIDIVSTVATNIDQYIKILRNNVGVPIELNTCGGGAANAFSDAGGTTFQWQQAGLTGVFVNINDNGNFSGTQTSTLHINNIPVAWNQNKYRCIIDNHLYSSTYLLKVKPVVLPLVTISNPNTTICFNTPVTFKATLSAGSGINTDFVWLINGAYAANGPSNTFTTVVLVNNDKVTCVAVDYDSCNNIHLDTSNVIAMTVYGSPNALTINASATSICSGTSVTFTATSVLPGVSSVYEWRVNGIAVAGATTPIFTTSTLHNNDVVYCIQWMTPTCGAYSGSIAITVNISAVTPSVNISISNSSICPGALAAFTASTTNGGSLPIYQWKVNGVNAGTNSSLFSSSTLSNNDQISCVLTSNIPCATTNTATSNNISISVIPVVNNSISISGNTTVIRGATTSILSLITNGGTNPVYLWQDSTASHSWLPISGATASSLSYSPSLTGDRLRCLLTSNALCSSATPTISNILKFTVDTVVRSITGKIVFYPNPATTKLTIDSLLLTRAWQTATIIASNGSQTNITQNISGQTKVVLNIAQLPEGLYIAILTNKDGETAYFKFVKI